MAEPGLVGVGASAGGVEALYELVAGLEADLEAGVLVIVHQAAGVPPVLGGLLDRRCALDVATARDGERIEPGRVLVCPPDVHLNVVDGRVELRRGPHENGHRPAIDPLFRSLALEAGPRATGVVLSGLLDDGAAGLLDVVRHGGTAVVQDPHDAQFDAMPRAALARVPGAVVRRAAALGPLLSEMARRAKPRSRPAPPSPRLSYEVEVSRGGGAGRVEHDPPGPAAGLACPDCAGPLFAMSSDEPPRYRCRTGHAWSHESLAVEQDDVVERALYAALRALEDKIVLSHRVAASAAATGARHVADRSRESAREATRAATVLRRMLFGRANLDGSDDGDRGAG